MNGAPKQVLNVACGALSPRSVPATLAVYPERKWYIACSGDIAAIGGRTPNASAASIMMCLRVPHRALLRSPRDIGKGIGRPGVLREVVVVQVDPPRLGIHPDVLEDRPEHPRRPVDLRLHLLGEPDHLRVAAALEVEDPPVAPAVLVVPDQVPRRVGGQRGLPRPGKAEDDRHVVLVPPVARRAVHREDAPLRQEEVHHGEDRLLDLARVEGAADDHFLPAEVDEDEDLAAGAVHLGTGMETRRADHRELGNVGRQLLRVEDGAEHVAGEEALPRELRDDPDGQPVLLRRRRRCS